MTVVSSLLNTAKIKGVQDLDGLETADQVIDSINGALVFSASNVTLASPTGSTEYWGTKVSDMQTSVSASNGAITGTLKKLTTGQLVTDWGEGYFLALKFTKANDKAVSVKVGLRPSVSNMPLQELDADMDGVFKITDKDNQVFIVRATDADGNAFNSVWDLSGLTLSDS